MQSPFYHVVEDDETIAELECGNQKIGRIDVIGNEGTATFQLKMRIIKNRPTLTVTTFRADGTEQSVAIRAVNKS